MCRAEACEDRDVRATPKSLSDGLRQVNASSDGDDVDVFGGTVEEKVTHVAADDVGVYAEFVRRLTDEVEEWGIYLIVDFVFLFVEQVFAEHPFS